MHRLAIFGLAFILQFPLLNFHLRAQDIITPVAGSGPSDGIGGFSGDGGPATSAQLDSPEGVAVDAAGNLYIADRANHRIRKVDTNGIITTVAGDAERGFSGDGGPATSASLSDPRAVAVDAAGNLFIADTNNNRIRKVTFTPSVGPTLPPNSVVNGASFRAATEPRGAVAPGTMVSFFGTELAGSLLLAESVPLPTTLGDTSVLFNGIAAPLFTVSGAQINAQVPFDVLPGEVQVQVKRGSQTSATQSVTVAPVSPGIFSVNQQGTGQGAVLISNTGNFAAPSGSIPGRETRPANRLEYISIYCTGLGDVTNRPPSGSPLSGGGLSVTMETPTVTIGGIEVQPSFSGLTGFVGLYQVNVQVPSEAPTGAAVELVITIGGVPSNTVTIAVQ
jgi:uncharacterized protein (TIGR03437 family)